MWLFIILTQLLALSTSIILWWFFQPKSLAKRIILIFGVFLLSNMVLLYGLSDFWRERFRLYLMFSILQGFLIYAFIIIVLLAVIYCKGFKRPAKPRLIRLMGIAIYFSIVGLAIFNAYSPVVHQLSLTTDKTLTQPMRMVLISDTHLGKWFGNR